MSKFIYSNKKDEVLKSFILDQQIKNYLKKFFIQKTASIKSYLAIEILKSENAFKVYYIDVKGIDEYLKNGFHDMRSNKDSIFIKESLYYNNYIQKEREYYIMEEPKSEYSIHNYIMVNNISLTLKSINELEKLYTPKCKWLGPSKFFEKGRY